MQSHGVFVTAPELRGDLGRRARQSAGAQRNHVELRVTRHGRVVFYDYDELCSLTACNFRTLPPPSGYADEMAAEPWFYVDENDVFPEELLRFLELSGTLRNAFLEHHADLFEVHFWQQCQDMIHAGELPHIFPYAARCRIKRI